MVHRPWSIDFPSLFLLPWSIVHGLSTSLCFSLTMVHRLPFAFSLTMVHRPWTIDFPSLFLLLWSMVYGLSTSLCFFSYYGLSSMVYGLLLIPQRIRRVQPCSPQSPEADGQNGNHQCNEETQEEIGSTGGDPVVEILQPVLGHKIDHRDGDQG